MVKLLSKEDLDANRGPVTILPEDEYLVEIAEVIEEPNKPVYNAPDKTEDQLQVRLRPLSFADESALVDEEDNPVPEGHLFFTWITPARSGFMGDNPSFARKFFASALGVPVRGEIEVPPYEELVGAKMIATVAVTEKAGKPRRNKVTDFKPIKRPRRAKAALTPVEAAKEVLGAEEVPEEELPF